jgi:hypothetical protein
MKFNAETQLRQELADVWSMLRASHPGKTDAALERNNLNASNAELVSALREMVEFAEETFTHWNEDRDAKVGKRLLAMSGGLVGYSKVTGSFHAILSKHESSHNNEVL